MADSSHYVIRGGAEGRERLRLLGRVMGPSTMALFDRLGFRDGMRCVDVGCGGGDVTLELARRAGHPSCSPSPWRARPRWSIT